MSTPPAGWYADPTTRFEQRFWDGFAWTDHVWASGEQSLDSVMSPTQDVESQPSTSHSSTIREGQPATEAANTHLVFETPQADAPSIAGSSDQTGLDGFAKFSATWSRRKQDRKSHESVSYLLPGETVVYQGQGGTWKPLTNDVVVTDARVFTYGPDGIGMNLPHELIRHAEKAGHNIRISLSDGTHHNIGSVPPKDMDAIQSAIERGRTSNPAHETRTSLASMLDAQHRAQLPIRERWLQATILGDVSNKADVAIQRLCQDDEAPWLVLAPGFAQGVLAAFIDRLAIIKTGAMTSFMAGSLGGERSTTFYFVDVNAIEYNSGFASGVLEILTASYQGTSNKDYWRGTNRSRNANSDDPYTLSNTLPMAKTVYNQWSPQIQELRSRISAAKRPVAIVAPEVAEPSSRDLVAQLEKLAALHAAGHLTSDEFAAAKARLMES